MEIQRGIAGLAAIAAATLGLGMVTAAPAAADSIAGWHAYGNTNPISSSSADWVCGTTKAFDTNVLAQACVAQAGTPPGKGAAVIVRNNRSSLYGAQVAMTLNDWPNGTGVGRWTCGNSGVAAHSWSVCFGDFSPNLPDVYVKDAGVNGQPIPSSGWL